MLRQFAVLSFLVIAVIALVLTAVVSWDLRRDLLEREWSATADFIRTGIHQHLSAGDFLNPANPASRQHFLAMYAQAVKMPEIARVKFYDAAMQVVWSDEPRLIGQRFAENPHLLQAITGLTVVNLQQHEGRKQENLYEGREYGRLVEVYVPVRFPGSSRVVGVVETYKVPEAVFESIRKAQLTVVETTAVGGLVLYLSLFWIVRRASRRIDEQHRSLESRGRELAAANRELTAVQGQLLEAERLAAIGEVVTAVAHGIRNPLANIRASAQVAGLDAQAQPAEATARHLANIISETDRLDARLKELLQFVRPAVRGDAPVNLNAVVEEALQMMAERLKASGIRLVRDLAADLPPVCGNSLLLEQVVLSLLANAVEAQPEGGGALTVTTGGSSASQTLFLEVHNPGTPIPAEHLPLLFTPFFTTKAQGTGLGLAIASKFAAAHGGTLAVSSTQERGTAFRVTLPAAAQE